MSGADAEAQAMTNEHMETLQQIDIDATLWLRADAPWSIKKEEPRLALKKQVIEKRFKENSTVTMREVKKFDNGVHF